MKKTNDSLAENRRFSLTFPGLPLSTNRAWRAGVGRIGNRARYYKSALYIDYCDSIAAFVARSRVKIPNDWKFVGVELILSPPTRRDVDVDNRFKSLFDALTNCGFWSDDKIVADVRASLTEPIKGGRTIVIFERRERKYRVDVE